MASAEPFQVAIPLLDEAAYSHHVLHGEAEEELDRKVLQEASELGIEARLPSVENPTSSVSATTISSDALGQRLSHSTGPTSCSSSDHRPITQSSDISPPPSPSVLSELSEKKHRLSFRGIRKIAGFKRRSSGPSPKPLGRADVSPSIFQSTGRSSTYRTNGNNASTATSPVSPNDRDLILPWCFQTPFQSVSQLFPDEEVAKSKACDKDAMQRTQDCHELQTLLKEQLEECNRFLDFQHQSRRRLRAQQALAMQILRDEHSSHVQKMCEHNGVLADELEQRQLQAEMDLRSELDAKKQACLIRLKHMEAYCRSPTVMTPETSPSSSRGAGDFSASVTSHDEQSTSFYNRRVTDQDYRNLAAQYRERDAMDGLHQSKIEVLRGKQERQLRQFTAKKQREVNDAVAANDRTEKSLDADSLRDLDTLQQALDEKKVRLEWRWKVSTAIEVAKMEAKTGTVFAVPDELKVDIKGIE